MEARTLIDRLVPCPMLTSLLSLREAGPNLGTFKTDRLTSKMWILPDGEVVPLNQWHFPWLLSNATLLKERFGLEFPYKHSDGEQVGRLWALRHGFVRINYERNGGRLVVEAGAKSFGPKTRDTIFMLCADNLGFIDNMTVTLLSDDDKVTKTRSVRLMGYSKEERLDHLPLISDSQEAGQRLAVWLDYLHEKAL